MHLFDVLAILCTVSMTGTEFTVSAILNPAFDRLDRGTWLKTMPLLAQAMGRAMPVWYGLCLLLIGIEGYLHYNTDSRWWLVTAALLWMVGIVYSVTLLVPINNRIADANSALASSMAVEHKRWMRCIAGESFCWWLPPRVC